MAISRSGTSLSDVLSGSSGADTLYGLGGNDTLYGFQGDDWLDGSAGMDLLYGGTGNDVYVVDNTADRVVEYLGEGIDRVQSSVSWTLGLNIEHLTLTGSAALSGTGNTLANQISGNDGANRLSGGDGNDTLDGGLGNDTLDGGTGNDLLRGGLGHDSLLGLAGDDTLDGGLGNSTLDGGDGNDSLTGSSDPSNTDLLIGGNGNDWMHAQSGRDTLLGGAGNDTMQAYGNGVQMTGGAGNDWLYGSGSMTAFFNRGDGQDTLGARPDTALGINTLQFGAGITKADIDVRASGSDLRLTLRGTTDSVTLQQFYAASARIGPVMGSSVTGAQIVRFADGSQWTLEDLKSIVFSGTTGNDSIRGTIGADTLSGGAGVDTLVGYEGNDTYVVDNALDQVSEQTGHGTDTVISSVSWTLGTDIENLTLSGSAQSGTGNAQNNLITGNGLANILSGLGGDDWISGGSGDSADTLLGGAGNDTLVGNGLGTVMRGGTGNDFISARTGAATILFDRGDGQDTIGARPDTALFANALQFGTGIAKSDIDVRVSGSDLVLSLRGTTDAVTLQQFYAASPFSGPGIGTRMSGAQTVRFADGSQWSLDDLKALVFAGTSGNDSIRGSFLADTLHGGAGNDTLEGFEGNDWLDGGYGSNTIDGGAGNDTVIGSFTEADLIQGGEGDDSITGGAYGTDTILGGTGNDTITANGSALITGGTGNDVLRSLGRSTFVFNRGDGQDVLLARNDTSLNDNTLQFGAGITQADVAVTLSGNDLVLSLRGTTDSVTLNMYRTPWMPAQNAGADIGGRLSGAQIVRFADGSQWGPDELRTLALTGTTGNDSIHGSYLSDTLNGGTGNDMLVGYWGNDTYVVDSLLDQVVEQAGAGTDTVITSVSGWTLGANVEHLTLTGSALTGSGNTLVNVITGNALANTLSGNTGDDTLYGLDGADLLDGGAGSDWMAGGEDADWYIVDNIGDVVIENGTRGKDRVLSQLNSYTLGESIEDLRMLSTGATLGIGNQLANEITVATNANTTLHGLGGDDRIFGGDGHDSLYGGTGNDNLEGGAGSNWLNGEDGNDTMVGWTGTDTLIGGNGDDLYLLGNTATRLIESAGGGTDTVSVSSSYALTDNFENLILSGSQAYWGTGNAQANAITGNDLANTLYGLDGNDTIYGMAGNDWIDGGNGSNTIDGGTGNDTIIGSGPDSDLLIGGDGNDSIRGLDGADTLRGGAGNDMLFTIGFGAQISGDAGNDLISTSAGSATLFFNRGDGQDMVLGRPEGSMGSNTVQFGAGIAKSDIDVRVSGNDLVLALRGTTDSITLQQFYAPSPFSGAGIGTRMTGAQIVRFTDGSQWSMEDLKTIVFAGTTGNDSIRGSFAADTISGGAGNDMLIGYAGDDWLDGGTGMDDMYGGWGNDTYVVNHASDRTIELAGEGVDTVLCSVTDWTLDPNVENLTMIGSARFGYGNASANVIVGSQSSNELYGMDGNDTIYGMGGNDVIIGGAGDSQLHGGEGSDTLAGSAGNDLLNGESGDDRLYAYGGQNTLQGGTGNDTIWAGAGADTYLFSRGDGIDLVIEAQDAGAAGDQLLFQSGIGHDQLWLSRSGNSLQISVIGTSDQVTIQDWYASQAGHVEQIRTSTGRVLLDTQVDTLVSAMAALVPPTAGQTSLSATQQMLLAPVLAASWS